MAVLFKPSFLRPVVSSLACVENVLLGGRGGQTRSKFQPSYIRPSSFASSSTVLNYSTKSLFRLNEANAGLVQPVLDIENVFNNADLLQESVTKRNLDRAPLSTARDLYAKAFEAKEVRDRVQKERDDNTEKVQALVKSDDKTKEVKMEEMKVLKENGRQLREQLREAESQFNQYNDQLVDYVLSLPNSLDPSTPIKDPLLLTEHPVPDGIKKWEFPDYTVVESLVGPGLLTEFPIGQSAWLDIHLREKAQKHLLDGGFIETGNAEYVRRVILQGAGIDHRQFLRIREPNMKRGWEHATYLAGGASFPSFLALFAQSIIDNPNALPLRYFVIGRSYETHKDRPGTYQNHNVQAFVGCRNREELEQEFSNLQGLMESFYSTKVGFPFQTQLYPAPTLKPYEKKKLAFIMNKTDDSPAKRVGSLSEVGDYVSKRLLCCYFDDKKQTQFLHMISAQFFSITHFLRNPQKKRRVDHWGNPILEDAKLTPPPGATHSTN